MNNMDKAKRLINAAAKSWARTIKLKVFKAEELKYQPTKLAIWNIKKCWQ